MHTKEVHITYVFDQGELKHDCNMTKRETREAVRLLLPDTAF